MCWFTLTPTKEKRDTLHLSDDPCLESVVRVHNRKSSSRFSDAKVKIPGGVSLEIDQHPHLQPHLNHRHPELHPHFYAPNLPHIHPIHGHTHHHLYDAPVIKLRGPGRKRCPTPPAAPPPSRDPSRCMPPPSPHCPKDGPKEPIYRTQIVEPTRVRANTRSALQTVDPPRQGGRLRRVAGYEMLGKEVPWTWDCVSSTAGSNVTGGGRWVRRRKGGAGSGHKYPPFGTMDRWL